MQPRAVYMATGLVREVECDLPTITFANSLDPDQARHLVWPDLDPSCLTLIVFLKEYLEEKK